MDAKLNELLKWSIENSSSTEGTPSNAPVTHRPIDPQTMAALFGGPSEAELMRAAMDVITNTDPEVTLDDKLVAFDNFEQLIESLDNANNLAPLSLWTPLLDLLAHEERELRRMAAWCVGTAVQNNEPSQERLVALGGIPRLVALATHKDGDDNQSAEDKQEKEAEAVRRKAIYALSSAVRNYQPAMDIAVEELAKSGLRSGEKVDATDMDAVDKVMDALRTRKATNSSA